MFCSQCGTRLNDTARYCEECGTGRSEGAGVGINPTSLTVETPGPEAPPWLRRGSRQGGAAWGATVAVQVPLAAVWWMAVGLWMLGALALLPAASFAVLVMGSVLWLALLHRRRSLDNLLVRMQARVRDGAAVVRYSRAGAWDRSLVRLGLLVTGGALASLWSTLYLQQYYYWSYWSRPRQIVLTLLLLASFWAFDQLWRRFTPGAVHHGSRLPRSWQES